MALNNEFAFFAYRYLFRPRFKIYDFAIRIGVRKADAAILRIPLWDWHVLRRGLGKPVTFDNPASCFSSKLAMTSTGSGALRCCRFQAAEIMLIDLRMINNSGINSGNGRENSRPVVVN